jgi:thiol:disulfide interchange protein DsbD
VLDPDHALASNGKKTQSRSINLAVSLLRQGADAAARPSLYFKAMSRAVRDQITFAAAALLAFASLGAGAGVEPLGGAGPRREVGEGRLVAEVRTISPGSSFLVSFRLRLPQDWHTYWRFAGDSGAPPALKWILPDGFTAGEVMYPVPKRIALQQFVNFGYEHEANLLVAITPPADLARAAPIRVALHADWLVCSPEVCIPQSGDFAVSLKIAAPGAPPEPDPEWNATLAREVAGLPRPAPFDSSLSVRDGQLELYVYDRELANRLKSGAIRGLEFYPYQDGVIRHSGAQTLAIGAEGAALRVASGFLFAQGTAPEPLSGLLVLQNRDGAREGLEISARRGAAVAGLTPLVRRPPQGGGSLAGFLVAAGLALAGGLILNLMPCVFPVLSMKVLGFLNRVGESPGALRRHGWLYTAGVVSSFLGLAAGLYVLRRGGAAIGWGYQLQSPILVLVLAYLMFALGLILLNVLTLEAAFAGIGQSLARRTGPLGDFMTGVLAAVVATPCTAPFMGAALGYALVAPAYAGAGIFLALGLGLALPYLALSHFPGVLRMLPRPGAWMERLKRLLAIPMLGSAAWLVWVLAQQAGLGGLAAALVGIVLIGFAAWASRAQNGGAGLRAWLGRAAAVAALAVPVGFVWLPAPAQTSGRDPAATVGEDWLPYSRARLDTAIEAGRPVFVDLTAAWCLTCKVNEWGALSAPRVRRAFEEGDVVRLRGDWTNRDPEITALLTEHDRIGVPLYLYYPENGGRAKILPQILTETGLLEVLGK